MSTTQTFIWKPIFHSTALFAREWIELRRLLLWYFVLTFWQILRLYVITAHTKYTMQKWERSIRIHTDWQTVWILYFISCCCLWLLSPTEECSMFNYVCFSLFGIKCHAKLMHIEPKQMTILFELRFKRWKARKNRKQLKDQCSQVAFNKLLEFLNDVSVNDFAFNFSMSFSIHVPERIENVIHSFFLCCRQWWFSPLTFTSVSFSDALCSVWQCLVFWFVVTIRHQEGSKRTRTI